MWIDKSWLKEMHPVNKVVSGILMVVAILFIKNPYYLLAINALFFFLLKGEDWLEKGVLVSFVLNLLALFVPFWLGFSKFLLILLYGILVLSKASLEEMEYLLEIVAPINSSFSIRLSNRLSFLRLLKKRYRELERIGKSYGLPENTRLKRDLIKRCYNETKMEMTEIKTLKKLRFYGVYPRRTRISSYTFHLWDRNYLMGHILFLIFALVLGG